MYIKVAGSFVAASILGANGNTFGPRATQNFSKPSFLDTFPCPRTTSCNTSFDEKTGEFTRGAAPTRDTFNSVCSQEYNPFRPIPKEEIQLLRGKCHDVACGSAQLAITTLRTTRDGNSLSAVRSEGNVTFEENGTIIPREGSKRFYIDGDRSWNFAIFDPCHGFLNSGILLVGLTHDFNDGCVSVWTVALKPTDPGFDVFASGNLGICKTPTTHTTTSTPDPQKEENTKLEIMGVVLSGVYVVFILYLINQYRSGRPQDAPQDAPLLMPADGGNNGGNIYD